MAKDLELEKGKTDALLFEMLPASVAQQLKSGMSVDASWLHNQFQIYRFLGEYQEATVMFCDVPSFQQIVPHCAPKDVVTLLNDLFTKFDRLVILQKVGWRILDIE